MTMAEQEQAKGKELATVRRARWLVGFGRNGGAVAGGTAMSIAGVSETEYLKSLDWTDRKMHPPASFIQYVRSSHREIVAHIRTQEVHAISLLIIAFWVRYAYG